MTTILSLLLIVKGDPATRIGDKDGAGYDPRKLLDSVRGHYGPY